MVQDRDSFALSVRFVYGLVMARALWPKFADHPGYTELAMCTLGSQNMKFTAGNGEAQENGQVPICQA